jgi:hypothetical protein
MLGFTDLGAWFAIDWPILPNVVCIISLWIFAFYVSGRVRNRTQNLVCINSLINFFLQFDFGLVHGFVDLYSWCVWFALSLGVIYIPYFGCIFLLLLSQTFCLFSLLYFSFYFNIYLGCCRCWSSAPYLLK